MYRFIDTVSIDVTSINDYYQIENHERRKVRKQEVRAVRTKGVSGVA
jgi:hypothetical protein